MWDEGIDLDTSIQYYNSPSPGTGTIQTRRPYPTFARIRALDFKGASNYNALQEQPGVEGNAQSNITASYVWSHMFDTRDFQLTRADHVAMCGIRMSGLPERTTSGTTSWLRTSTGCRTLRGAGLPVTALTDGR